MGDTRQPTTTGLSPSHLAGSREIRLPTLANGTGVQQANAVVALAGDDRELNSSSSYSIFQALLSTLLSGSISAWLS